VILTLIEENKGDPSYLLNAGDLALITGDNDEAEEYFR
jgi:hypothetical protein